MQLFIVIKEHQLFEMLRDFRINPGATLIELKKQ